MPEEKDKLTDSSGSLFNSELEEPKPTKLIFGSETVSETERVPTRISFDKEKSSYIEPVEKKPTILRFPKKESKEEDESSVQPTRVVFDKLPEPGPTRITFEFPKGFAAPKDSPKPTILFSAKVVRKRLEVSQGELKELYPNVSKVILDRARHLVLILNIQEGFANTCSTWGVELQQKAAGFSERYACVVNSELMPKARLQIHKVQEHMLLLQFKGRPRSWLQRLVDPKTPKELFEKRYQEVQLEAKALSALLPDLELKQKEIRDSMKALKQVEEDLLVYAIAGQLVEFRALLGDVEKVNDTYLLQADLEVLKNRLNSLQETISNIEALKVHQQALYREIANLIEYIHDTLLVELPNWYHSMLVSGFINDDKVDDSAQWERLDAMMKKLQK